MARAYKKLPPAEVLWELFSLDPFTGTLYWRIHRTRTRIGKPFGCKFSNGYVVGEINNEKFSAHRLVWKWLHAEEPQEVDHKNHNKTDNSPWNLRSNNRSANHCNRSGVKGYTRTKEGKYRALIGIHGTQYYLGHYDTKTEAREAYEAAASLLHGMYVEEKRLPATTLERIKVIRAKKTALL